MSDDYHDEEEQKATVKGFLLGMLIGLVVAGLLASSALFDILIALVVAFPGGVAASILTRVAQQLDQKIPGTRNGMVVAGNVFSLVLVILPWASGLTGSPKFGGLLVWLIAYGVGLFAFPNSMIITALNNLFPKLDLQDPAKITRE